MSRNWGKNNVVTKEQLVKEYGVINVTPWGWTTSNGVFHEPTVSPQLYKEKITYVVCQACLYGGKSEIDGTYKYLRIPFSKMVYAWFNGATTGDKVIDHINQNPLDCRPENLREVDEYWNLTKNSRVWCWPQSHLLFTESRRERKISYKKLVFMVNKWILECNDFYEKCLANPELFKLPEAKERLLPKLLTIDVPNLLDNDLITEEIETFPV